MRTKLLRKLRKRFSAQFHIKRVSENKWKIFEYRKSGVAWEDKFEYSYDYAKTLTAAQNIKKDLIRASILGYIAKNRDPYKIKCKCDKYLY